MSLFFKALLVAIVTGLCEMDIYGWGQLMTERPLIVGFLVGLVLGDIKTGLLVGGSVELMYLGVIYVGAAIPPDATAGCGIATALAIMSGMEPKAASTLAIPVAVLASFLSMAVWTLFIGLMHHGDKVAEEGNDRAIEKMTYFGTFVYFLVGAIPAFLAVFFGVNAVKAMVAVIPDKVMIALKVAGGMLPALGFGMLFNMMYDKKLVPFFIIGFAAAAFLKLGLIAAALFGLGAALLYIQIFDNGSSSRPSQGNNHKVVSTSN